MCKLFPLSILVVMMFVLSAICPAADIYITQNTSGSDTGANCANAHSTTWFNSNQAGGNTYHLCGTFTGAAGATILNVSAGSAGNVKTILFESGAGMTAPVWGSGAGAWPSGAAININGSYVTVDGGTNGYIKATLSGAVGTSCSGGSCVYDQTTAGILVAASANNVEVKNLTITDIYRCNNASACNTNWYTAGIMVGISANNNNLSIHDNTISQVGTEIMFQYGGAISNINIYNNTLGADGHGGYWGIAVGTGSSGTPVSNVNIYGNAISGCTDWTNQYNPSNGNGYHCDGVIVYSSSGAQPFNIYNNYISFAGPTTADVFCTYGSATPGATCNIFNNVLLINNPTCYGVGRSAWMHGGSGPHAIVNNTLVGVNAGCYLLTLESGTSISRLQNNIFTQENWAADDGQTGNLSLTDYNLYNASGAMWNYNGSYKSFAQWQALGFDTNGKSADPLLNSDYTLQSSSPARSSGKNLYSVCNGQPIPGLGALCYDKAGSARPSSGAWDAGAYQYSGGGIAPPSHLVATVH